MTNPWIIHVKKVAKEKNLKYKDALKVAKATYKPKKKTVKSKKMELEGDGILQNIKEFVGEKIVEPISKKGTKILKSRPRQVQKLLKNYGNKNIISLTICRTPVTSAIQKALNLFSKNKFDDTIKEKSYDDMFHLYLIMNFEDGTSIGIEKNQVVRVVLDAKKIVRKNTVCKSANVSIKLNDLIEQAEQSHPNLYRYVPWKYNCQDFVNTLLKVANAPKELSKFVLQDFKQAFDNTPSLKKLSVSITDVAGLASRLMGAGKHKKKKNN